MRSRSWMRRQGSVPLIAYACAAALVALWAFLLVHRPGDGGSLDARVTAVGATVRCPICPEPIALNDVQNVQAIQMRQFIGDRLQQGLSEDEVRRELVARYGNGILLTPPQTGFNLLIWLVPLCAILACAVAVQCAAQRWVTNRSPAPTARVSLSGLDARRYDEVLDRELALRE